MTADLHESGTLQPRHGATCCWGESVAAAQGVLPRTAASDAIGLSPAPADENQRLVAAASCTRAVHGRHP